MACVWLSEQVIAGAPEALASLRASGSRVVLLTNNSYPRRSDHVAKLERLGMPTDPADVLSSAMAAALLLEAGERALVLGGPGIIEELTARGVATVTPGTGREIGPVDAVVVGLDPSFDFSSIAAAVAALHAGARLIGTNDDPSFPTPAGVLPGAGALLAAVACASGVTPTIAGKPYQPTVDLVRKRVGEVEMVVGDRAFHRWPPRAQAGCPFRARAHGHHACRPRSARPGAGSRGARSPRSCRRGAGAEGHLGGASSSKHCHRIA